MTSCEGCAISKNGMQQQYAEIRNKAVLWQQENKVDVVIYQEGYEYSFMKESAAKEAGILPKEFITYKG